LVRERVLRELDLTVYHAAGALDRAQLLTALERAYAAAPTRDALWDLRAATESGLSAEDFELVAAWMGRHAAERSRGRTAFVCHSELDADVLRMYGLLVQLEHVDVEFRIFYEPEAAAAWLGRPLEPLLEPDGD